MNTFWKVFIAVIASMIIAGDAVWYYENQKMNAVTNDLNSQIDLLRSQVNTIKKSPASSTNPETTTKNSSSSSTNSATTQANELAAIKTFCTDLATGDNILYNYYYFENSDGKFASCSIGDQQRSTGYVILSKKIDNQWTKIWSGNGIVSQTIIDQYKIPRELY